MNAWDQKRTVPYLAQWPGGKQAISPVSYWWTWTGSNRRPLPCHGSATLPIDSFQLNINAKYACGPDPAMWPRNNSVPNPVLAQEALHG